jgi:hypothetical protein
MMPPQPPQIDLDELPISFEEYMALTKMKE